MQSPARAATIIRSSLGCRCGIVCPLFVYCFCLCCAAGAQSKTRNRASKHVENMLPETFKNEAPVGRKYKQKCFKQITKCSKMSPWRPLGGPWAPTLLPEPSRSRPGEALGRPGASRKLLLAALRRPWDEKLIDFTLPGAPREGPGGALGGHFGSILAAGPAGTKKLRNITIFLNIFDVVFILFLCFFFAFPAAPAQARPLKNRFSCGRYSEFRLPAVFARNEKTELGRNIF